MFIHSVTLSCGSISSRAVAKGWGMGAVPPRKLSATAGFGTNNASNPHCLLVSKFSNRYSAQFRGHDVPECRILCLKNIFKKVRGRNVGQTTILQKAFRYPLSD